MAEILTAAQQNAAWQLPNPKGENLKAWARSGEPADLIEAKGAAHFHKS